MKIKNGDMRETFPEVYQVSLIGQKLRTHSSSLCVRSELEIFFKTKERRMIKKSLFLENNPNGAKSKEQFYHYKDCGLSKVFLIGIEIQRCTNKECGEEEIIIPQLEELHNILAEKIASSKNKLLPEEIRFLRTHLGFSGADFAAYMGVSPETVSRWEKGSVNMKEATERLLRVLILAKQGPFREYDELKEFATMETRTALKRTFKIDHSHWHEENAA